MDHPATSDAPDPYLEELRTELEEDAAAGATEPATLEELADRLPYVEHYRDAAGDHRAHVIAGNGRTIVLTEGYERVAGTVHALELTLAALLRHPGLTGTVEEYLATLDPTTLEARRLADALAGRPPA